MKNDFFNSSRFCKVVKKDFFENYKINILRFLVMYGTFTIIFLWRSYWEYKFLRFENCDDVDPLWCSISPVFCLLILLFGCLYSSLMLDQMKTKTKRISLLMNPSTVFEKYFSRWFMAVVVYLIVFLVAFELADLTRVAIYTIAYPHYKFILPFNVIDIFDVFSGNNDGGKILLLVSCYFVVQSFFVLGSTIWNKNVFVKTFVAGTIMVFMYSFISLTLVSNLWEGISFSEFRWVTETHLRNCMSGLFISVTIFNWVMGYFRFKEAEIIHRN